MTYDTINDAMTMQGGAEKTLLAGRYHVVRQLGQGGMGSVWLAEDTQLDNKLFAIKMLPSILVSNKRAYRQLKDEALVAMQLVHPNIVQIRAFEENSGNPFLVMDYIDGETLDDYLAEVGNGEWGTADAKAMAVESGNGRRGGLSEDEVIRILKPIAAALDYAHSKGVVHRDVKPGNVMIDKDGTPYILDFGIAREIQETMTRVTGKLSSGTLLYMSPEQLNGDAPKPPQDVYSFAAMAYECLKGEPPFVRGAIEDQIKNKIPEPPVGRDDPIAPLADGIIAGLAKRPEDRPKTCAAVLEGKVFSRVERVERVDGKASRRVAETQRKSGAGMALAALALVAGISVGGWIYHQNQESRRANKTQQKPTSTPREMANSPTVKLQSTLSRTDVDAIYVEARVQMASCGRLDPSDDFKSRIEDRQKSFDSAKALYDLGRLAEAALAFTNVVGECKALIEQSKARDKAKTAADDLADAIKAAQSAGAKEYAPDRFSSSDDLAKRGRREFDAFKFADAAATYASAQSQFYLAAKEAEQAKQEEARRKREAEEAAQRAEAERRAREAREAAERERKAQEAEKPRVYLKATLNGVSVPALITGGMQENNKYTAPLNVDINLPIGASGEFAAEYSVNGVKYAGKAWYTSRKGLQNVEIKLHRASEGIFPRPATMNFCRHCRYSLKNYSTIGRTCPNCGKNLFGIESNPPTEYKRPNMSSQKPTSSKDDGAWGQILSGVLQGIGAGLSGL